MRSSSLTVTQMFQVCSRDGLIKASRLKFMGTFLMNPVWILLTLKMSFRNSSSVEGIQLIMFLLRIGGSSEESLQSSGGPPSAAAAQLCSTKQLTTLHSELA